MKLPRSLPPAIKWSGSKRLQAPLIVRFFPKFKTYYEPFVGGGSVVGQLAPPSAVCGDICQPLIEFWYLLQTQPGTLVECYRRDWMRLQTEGWRVFYEIRRRFNNRPNPFDLLFLSRTCVNGLVRFNREGKFNNSLHYSRPGIKPAELAQMIELWSRRLKNVTFVYGDYRETTARATSRDFVYLDPPYFHTRGRFYGGIDYDEFIDFLNSLKERGIRYALSYDGIVGRKRYVVDLPRDLYTRHTFLGSGNSTFRKVMSNKVEPVKESLYLSWSDEEAKNPGRLLHFCGLEESVQPG
jgi:DNA adenine methylase